MYTHRYLIFDGLAVVGSIESNMEDMFADNMLSENASTLISHTDDPRTRSPVHVASGREAEEEPSHTIIHVRALTHTFTDTDTRTHPHL